MTATSLWLLLSIHLVKGQVPTPSPAPVTDYGIDIHAWAGQVDNPQALAFEARFSQPPDSGGCLTQIGEPIVGGTEEIALDGGGTLQISQSGGACPIRDGASLELVSDAYISNNTNLMLTFDPPVRAFYSYYSSLAIGARVSVTLLDEDNRVLTTLEGPPDPGSAARVGHGFVSEVPVRQMIFDSTEAGPTLLGAFYDLGGDQITFEDLGIRCPALPDYGSARCDFAYAYELKPFDEPTPFEPGVSYNGAVAMDTDTLLVTERGNRVDVFDRQGNDWIAAPMPIEAPNDGGGILLSGVFGSALALDGQRALVGSVLNQKAALFDRQSGGEFAQNLSFQPPDSLEQEAEFGTGVALRGNLAAVSAPLLLQPSGAKGDASSRVYLYQLQSGNQWALVDQIRVGREFLPVPAGPGFGSGYVGQVIFTGDDELMISNYREVATDLAGTVDVYRNNGTAWQRTQTFRPTLAAEPPVRQAFGGRLAADGDFAAIADPSAKRVYILKRDGAGSWQTETIIKPADEALVDQFGTALALDQERLLVGAIADVGSASRAIYVFERAAGGSWRQSAKLSPRDRGQGRPDISFSTALAAAGGSVVSPGSPESVYVFSEQSLDFPNRDPLFSDGFENAPNRR